ncbi:MULTISPECIES: type II toxin-antitoxin system HipA family toxin [unclassified Variovorax]|uniref:type II toxin-antitoxin system HipA family toxin n=1 Tax=unclassified Variovorax TaxID=663243 RepID=UPI003F456A4D
MTDLLAKVQAHAHQLDVYVGENRVGTLERQGAAGSVFAYLPDVAARDFASLLMPVRLESYAAPSALIPTFQQNLPEGFLRRNITERFGKVLATDDFVLLALTGANPIGRQRVVPSGFALNWTRPLQVDIDSLMADRQVGSLFAELLDRYIGFGVSGALPKVLVQGRATLRDEHWILKAGDASLPELATNEFFTMRAAQCAGLETPEFKLADNGAILAVKRFDHDELGNALGFEDFCALLAMPPERKYGGTMERIFKAIDACARGPQRIEAKETLMAAHLLSMAVGNTDAHLKNFGLVYGDASSVRLAPMFDMVTTKVYPQYKNDIPAISIAGKKLGEPDKTLVRFAHERAGLTAVRLREIAQRTAAGVEQARAEMAVHARAHPEFKAIGAAMARQWKAGVKLLSFFDALPRR